MENLTEILNKTIHLCLYDIQKSLTQSGVISIDSNAETLIHQYIIDEHLELDIYNFLRSIQHTSRVYNKNPKHSNTMTFRMLMLESLHYYKLLTGKEHTKYQDPVQQDTNTHTNLFNPRIKAIAECKSHGGIKIR